MLFTGTKWMPDVRRRTGLHRKDDDVLELLNRQSELRR